MSELVIRDMMEDDIPAILQIENISFSSPWSRESFLIQIFNKHALSKVALFEEKVIGYISASYMHHEANILNLAVDPYFRRQRVGSILMDEVANELKKRGCAFVYLKVRASDMGARKFYEHLGFKVEGVRKKYYDNPDEDGLFMMRRI